AETFNNYFFRQVVMLFAATTGTGYPPGTAAVLFMLPFVICSAWAGWLADRKPKAQLIIWTMLAGLGCMLLGIWALAQISWTGISFAIFFMGIQSAFFSPAINGAIPERFSASAIPRVNTLIKLTAVAVILPGMALAGFLLGTPDISFTNETTERDFWTGSAIAGIASALVGALAAFGVGKKSMDITPDAPFPALGPADSVRHAAECRREDPPLFLAIAGEAFFYAASFFVLLCINNLLIRQLDLGMTVVIMAAAALSIGFCIGAVVAGKRDVAVWGRHMLSAGTGMASGIFLVALAAFLPVYPLVRIIVLLPASLLIGVCAGLYLIPLTSFIQIYPADTEKGKVLGLSNFASFSGMMIAGFLLALFEWTHELSGGTRPAVLLAWSGLAWLFFLLWASRRLQALFPLERYSLLGTCLHLALSLRYRVTTSGLDTLNIKKPTLFLPNHPGLIDPFIVYSLLAAYSPRPLVDERQMTGLHGKAVAWFLNAVLIPDIMRDGEKAAAGARRGIHIILDSLKAGEHVLLYPSGRIYHAAKENIGGNSGAWSIIRQAPDIQAVLVRTTGLWGSAFGYGASGKAPDFARTLLSGVVTVLGNLLLLTPRRDVHVDFVEANDLASITDRRAFNRRLEAFYNETARPPVRIPRWFWQGAKPEPLPEPAVHQNVPDTGDVNPATRETVYGILRETAGLPDDHAIYDSMSLASDLGIDSLMLMEVSLAIEETFGQTPPELETFNTVADCLLAASGQLLSKTLPPPAPEAWFAPPAVLPLDLPEDEKCLVSAFLRQLRHNPDDPLLAERSALRSRRRIFLGALLLAKRFRELPGERLGMMMPAVPAAAVAWLGALLAGKVPVFFNWTVGELNLKHCIALTGVTHIVSVTPLMDRLKRQRMPVDDLFVEWLPMEDLAASFSIPEKAYGIIQSYLPQQAVRFPVPETAAVLFTSGSESFPKAVPLTHENLLTNAVDIIRVLNLSTDDTVLATLPPFHSFGLMAGLAIPLATGFRAVFHPNPAEPALINGLVRDYRISLLAMPPTFMKVLLDQARGSDDLASVKYAFVGAEKCPQALYRAFAAQCPSASLCEGYGITECSPAVSVNRPGDVRPGAIGPLLPSVKGVIVREKDGVIQGRTATGRTGMLLLQGPSIFHGYLGDAPSPFVLFEGESWYRTGDLVSMDKAGRLTFRGRLGRFVKVGGEMISMPQIEETLLEAYSHHPDAPEEGAVLAVEATPEDDGTSVIVLFTPLHLTLAEVNATIRAAGLSPLYAVKRIEHISTIPLLGSGKTDYRALKESLSA
ncbi:MAG: MFS transporter, partial [Burkholderiaceae bacterium]|nr:MFS transporter [Burkholderiaceae bacterium]